MNTLKIILPPILFVSQACFAQNKLLTIEDVVLKSKTTLAPSKLNQLKWIKGTNFYSYLDTANGGKLMKGMVSKNRAVVLTTRTELNTAFKKISSETLPVFPVIDWKNYHAFRFEAGNKVYEYDLLSKSVIMYKDKTFIAGVQHADVDSNTEAVAYTVENNIFIFKDGKKIQVTNDADKNILNGDDKVHREEFGISKGTFWSPYGNYLAFYRMDQTMVTDYPLFDLKVRPAKTNLIKYPMAGDKSHEVTVGIYELSTGKTIFVKTGEPKDQYLTSVTWSADEKFIYIAVLNRDQDHLSFNRYHARTGDFVKTLFEEKNDKYVQPLQPMVFVPGHADQFVWQSRRDGFNHLYLYDTNGTLIRQLTKGPWEITGFTGFNPSGETAYFVAAAEKPVNRDFYKVSLQSGEMKKLTNGNGTHTIKLNDACDFFFDYFSSTEIPAKISVNSTAGKEMKVLLASENPVKDYQLGNMSIFTLKSAAGDDLYCRMFKPVNFDSTKKYPVIIYLYSAPGVQLITNSWLGGGDLWYQYMAEKGFITFSIDTRGTANRGLKFEQAVFRNLGTVEMEDQLVSVNYLKSLPYVDQERMGIFGWSYGGYMTITMVTRNPGIFKAAVAGGPVIDWKYYEVMYTERYMDTPQTNPDGYNKSNLLNYVKDLDCRLMIIHGTSDETAVWQNSLMYLKKAVDLNKQLDYFVYPGHQHNVYGKDRVHLITKITNYFMDNL